MNSQVLVSVIIPTFNRAHCLAETLRSVFNQTFKKFEVIVVDDGSQDETNQIVAGFPEVKYYHLERNRGVSFARNFGIRRAEGKYICFLDSDDLWMPKKLETQFGYMQDKPDGSISYTDEIWIRNGVRVNPRNKHRKYSGYIFKKCLPLCIVSPSSVMIHSNLLLESGFFDEKLRACEDYDFWLRMALRIPFHFINRKLIVKRGGHSDQLSKRYWGMDRFRVYALEKLLCDERLTGENRQFVLQMLSEKCGILCKGFSKRKKIKEAEYYLHLKEKYESGFDSTLSVDALSNSFKKDDFNFMDDGRSW